MKTLLKIFLIIPFAMMLSTSASAQSYTQWYSPLTLATAESDLTVEQDCCPTTSMKVGSTAVDDNLWVQLGLDVPSNAEIDQVIVCYELSNASSFITQVRLTEMTMPNSAGVHHDDGTDLTDVGPACVISDVNSFKPEGAITLGLRLNFGSTDHTIKVGGIGVVITPASSTGKQDELPLYGATSLVSYPNPFKSEALIAFEIPEPSQVHLDVYDVQGRLIRVLADGMLSPGKQEIAWDGKDEAGVPQPSGVYFYQLNLDGQVTAKQAVLIR